MTFIKSSYFLYFQLFTIDFANNFYQTCIDDVKTFLKEHFNKIIIYKAIIFELVRIILISSIVKNNQSVLIVINNRQNKILELHKIKATHRFICFLFAHGIQLSKNVIFNIIITLKHA